MVNLKKIDCSSWYRSPRWDFTYFLSPYILFPVLAGVSSIYSEKEAMVVVAFLFILLRGSHILFNIFFCMFHPLMRPIAKEHKVQFFVFPFLLFTGVILLISIPGDIMWLSLSRREYILSFICFPLLIQWHLAGQHYGILCLYRFRTEERLSRFHIFFEKFFCIGVVFFFFVTFILYDRSRYSELFPESFIFTLDKLYLPFLFIIFTWVLALLCIGLELKLKKPSFPKILYIMVIPVMSTFFFSKSIFTNLMILDIQHNLAAIGLNGVLLANYEKSKKNGNLEYIINKKYVQLLVFSFFFAIIMYYFKEPGGVARLYALFFDGYIKQTSVVTYQRVFQGFWLASLLAHIHFDRILYKLSDPEVGPLVRKFI